MLPVLKNFTVAKGFAFSYTWQWLQGIPGPGLNGPQSLVGYTGSLVATSWDGLTTNLTLDSSAPAQGQSGIFFGGALGTPSNGIVHIFISATDAGAITWTTAKYTFSVTPPAGQPDPVLYGTIAVMGLAP